jgi:hypothetical protein
MYQGALNSPTFGRTISLGGRTFGPGSGGAANNRRLELSTLFQFWHQGLLAEFLP